MTVYLGKKNQKTHTTLNASAWYNKRKL